MKKLLNLLIYYTNPYRIYYRIYYYLFAKTVIAKPKSIIIPDNYKWCIAELDLECKKHKNFLYASVGKPSKWFFWKRKFAFKFDDKPFWFPLPSLTPWETSQDGITKFGLNYTFVEKWKGHQLQFITWK